MGAALTLNITDDYNDFKFLGILGANDNSETNKVNIASVSLFEDKDSLVCAKFRVRSVAKSEQCAIVQAILLITEFSTVDSIPITLTVSYNKNSHINSGDIFSCSTCTR